MRTGSHEVISYPGDIPKFVTVAVSNISNPIKVIKIAPSREGIEPASN